MDTVCIAVATRASFVCAPASGRRSRAAGRRTAAAAQPRPAPASGRRALLVRAGPAVSAAAAARDDPVEPRAVDILCLSNGHGEDTIAVAIIRELRQLAQERGLALRLEALPLVGVGSPYRAAAVPCVGPAREMPSGGFVYMDAARLAGDVQAGLAALTVAQIQAVAAWAAGARGADAAGAGAAAGAAVAPAGPPAAASLILTVGDLLPLAMASLAARPLPYAFVGCAKSEFYVKSPAGAPLPRPGLEAWLTRASVYLPWERLFLARPRCRLVTPRDGLTASALAAALPLPQRSKVQDLGNPMMDFLSPPQPGGPLERAAGLEAGAGAGASRRRRCFVVLPGTRTPEAHDNWRTLLRAARSVAAEVSARGVAPPAAAGGDEAAAAPVVFLAPRPPSLDAAPFLRVLEEEGWQPRELRAAEAAPAGVRRYVLPPAAGAAAGAGPAAELLALPGCFSESLHLAEAALATAGTATEQAVGLGLPALTIAGAGPQFGERFAEAQERLLGRSILRCAAPDAAGRVLVDVLADPQAMAAVAANGRLRMGAPGSSARIAAAVLDAALAEAQV